MNSNAGSSSTTPRPRQCTRWYATRCTPGWSVTCRDAGGCTGLPRCGRNRPAATSWKPPTTSARPGNSPAPPNCSPRTPQTWSAAAQVERLLSRWPQADQDPVVTHLLSLRGDLLADTVRAAEAEDAYRAALSAAGPPARPALLWRLARLLSQRGRPAGALALCAEAAETAEHLLRAPGHST